MDERGIIIADRDAEYRDQIADFFRKAGYRVETTESAVHVLCSILEKQTPVLLLGSDFDQKVCSADLIHLLKKCNRNLHVIMVSDDMPLSLARKVRQEGIFYHALKPASAEDTEELEQAVQCAFRSQPQGAPALPEPEPEAAPAPELSGPCRNPVRWPQALSWLIGMAVLVFGASLLALVAARKAGDGSGFGIWVLLAFCALVIACQMLPIFGTRIGLRLEQRRQMKEATRGK